MLLTISEIKEMESLMEARLKIDYTNFNVSFFRRRLAYVFKKLGIRRPQELKDMLGSLVKEDSITYCMAMPGTELFRDPPFWRQLRKLVDGRDGLHFWLPDLSSFHELYSLVIILHLAGLKNYSVIVNSVSDLVKADVKKLKISRHTNETDRSNFERLQMGGSFDEFFTTSEAGLNLRPELLNSVQFQTGWFMNADVQKYDVILCRNSLLCYNTLLHQKAVRRLVDSLNPGGMLCLGVKETPLIDAFADAYATDGIYLYN